MKFTIFRIYLKNILYLVIVLLSMVFLMKVWSVKSHDNPFLPKDDSSSYLNTTFPPIKSLEELKSKWVERKIARLSGGMNTKKREFGPVGHVDPKIHAFYYTWYRNQHEDGAWSRWFTSNQFPTRSTDLRTSYYPHLGFYSSKNITIIDLHMSLFKKSGIGVAVISWEPGEDELMKLLLDIADKHSIKIALHWRNLSPNSGVSDLLKNLDLFLAKFGQHNALFRIKKTTTNERYLPVIYVYEPFIVSSNTWNLYLNPLGNRTIRNSPTDAVFLALMADVQNRMDIKKSNFDGFYTYFAANGYTYGSSWKNWKALGNFASRNKLFFVPCVSPGYNDGTTYSHPRLNGNYYETSWKIALESSPYMIAINSFNAWEEGSQIEPAVAKTIDSIRFADYEKVDSKFYLDYTGFWVKLPELNREIFRGYLVSVLGVAAMLIVGGAMTYQSDRRKEKYHETLSNEKTK